MKKMLAFIQESGVQMVRCGRLHIKMDKTESIMHVSACYPGRQETLSNSEFASKYLEYRKNNALLKPVWNALYRRDFIEQHQIEFPEELRFGSEDVTFNYKMFLAGTDIAFLPDLLYVHYNREQQSTTFVPNPELILVNTRLANLEREFVRKGSEKNIGLLSYIQFDEIFERMKSVNDTNVRKKYVQNLVSQIPLKECPLKYLSRQVSAKIVMHYLLFWLLFRLYCYQAFFWLNT